MIDGREKRNRQLAFELQNLHICEKRNNKTVLIYRDLGYGHESSSWGNVIIRLCTRLVT